jgi:hypothetical protein
MCSMKSRSCLLLGCILMCLVAPLSSRADVELNGYTFPADSADLYKNPYYNQYLDRTSMGVVLHGYGDFTDKDINMWYNYPYTVAGIECAVMFEEGYYPTFIPDTSTFRMDYYQGYLYYARDTKDNIHILELEINLLPGAGNTWDWQWDYTDLSKVGTTLLYPASPVTGQKVFGGHVSGINLQVGDTQDCIVLTFDSLPQFPSKTVTQYLGPGKGLIAEVYNWQGRINGFSQGGREAYFTEETEKDSRTSWEKYRDKACFISACAP